MLLLPGVVLDNVHVLEHQHRLLALQTELITWVFWAFRSRPMSSSHLARLITADDRDSQTCLGHALEQSRGSGGFGRQKNWQNSVLFLVSFMHVWYMDKKMEQNSRNCPP